MLNKANLLSILRTASVFKDTDGGPRIKVVCRYQQFRAASRIVERLRGGATAEERSGVVWRTQGSGKSLTMAYPACNWPIWSVHPIGRHLLKPGQNNRAYEVVEKKSRRSGGTAVSCFKLRRGAFIFRTFTSIHGDWGREGHS